MTRKSGRNLVPTCRRHHLQRPAPAPEAADAAGNLHDDGLGRRTAIREWPNGYNYTETRYLGCGERICQARNSSDTPIRRYYDEGEQLVSATGITSYHYAQDHLGSVRDLVNASGTVLASYDYDPYGNPTRATSTNGARADYRYAGLFYHAQSGLYLTHYRVYDPVTARWLSRDPIGETGGINLYGYVGGVRFLKRIRWG